MPQQWVVLLLHFKCSLQAEVGCLLKLVLAENHHLHQQNWMQTGNQTNSIRKRKQRLFHLLNWKMVLLLSRAAASNFVHYHKTHLTQTPFCPSKKLEPLIRWTSSSPFFVAKSQREAHPSKSRRSCCPWRCPFFETEVAYWDSTRRTGGTVSCWDRALFEAKKCWFYAWWSLSDPNCCREISGLEGCLK